MYVLYTVTHNEKIYRFGFKINEEDMVTIENKKQGGIDTDPITVSFNRFILLILSCKHGDNKRMPSCCSIGD